MEVKVIKLTPEQFVWVTSLNYRTDSGWETDKGNNGKYQDNLELKVQVWVKSDGTVQITTWQADLN